MKSNSLIRCLVFNHEQDEEDHENKENIMESAKEEEIKMELEEGIEDEIIIDEKELQTSIEKTDHDYENPQNYDISTSSLEDIPEQMNSSNSNNDMLTFKSKNELLDYITKNVSVDELLEKLTQMEEESMKRKELIEKVLRTIDFPEMLNEILPLPESRNSKLPNETIETTSIIINHISKLMKVNDRIKHKVLDTLSEKHSKDFLSHALQENSTTTVCEKITIPNVVNYIIHKANVCDENDMDFEINRMNRTIMHHLIKKTADTREIISDQKETQELLKLLFKNKPKIDILDTVHEFLRNVIQGSY